MSYTLAELEEKYLPERLERLVNCPKCGGGISVYRLNNPCKLCLDKGNVTLRIYREYWKNKRLSKP